MTKRAVFTITAGRTGTGYLAQLFANNLNCRAVHEAIGPRDFGLRTPEIGHMRQYNCLGNTPRVKEFWANKWRTLPETHDLFVETSHLNAKAGLMVNLPTDVKVDIILLRRNWLDTARSYKNRFDFLNKFNEWQCYLDWDYPANIISKNRLPEAGWHGKLIWYLSEIEARQEFARLKWADQVNFIDCNLEDIVKKDGAQALLEQFGLEGEVKLPGKTNESDAKLDWPDDDVLVEHVSVARQHFDPVQSAKEYYEATDECKDWELFE